MAKMMLLSLQLLGFIGFSHAFWRLPCRERTGVARIDPLVDTGRIGSHAHAIHGGNNFGFSTTPEQLATSQCTSCAVTQDKSAYWTPPLYFMYANGTAEMVEEVGGMLAYYLLYTNPGPDTSITAFPPGFGMLAGDPARRNFTCKIPEPPKSDWTGDEITQPALAQKALGFNCLNYALTPEPSLYRHFLPDKTYLDQHCRDGLRLELMFPSCWNGEDLNPPDHKSHMAYPDLVMTGTCPPGYGTKTPSLFFETIWNTAAYSGVDGEFVLGNGDPTGYGYHGDFMFGWEDDVLQRAVDTCTNPSGQVEDCPVFNLQSDSEAARCTFPMPTALEADNALGPRQGLPGDNPIQSGPAPARADGGRAVIEATATPAPPASTTLAVSGLAPQITSRLSAKPVEPSLFDISVATLATDEHGGGLSFFHSDELSATLMNDNVHRTTITASPSEASAEACFLSTKWATEGNSVWEILIQEQIVTATASTAREMQRRDTHKQHRHHAHKHNHHHVGLS